MKKITAFLIVVAIGLIVWISNATVPQTQTTLKSYFQTGLRPSQAQYAELIDTMFWYAGQSYTNAQYAAQQAANLQTIYQGYVNFTIIVGATITNSINNNFNVAVVTVTNSFGAGVDIVATNNNGVSNGAGPFNIHRYKCNIVFSNALPGVNDTLFFSSPGTAATVTSGNQFTMVRIDGYNCGNVSGYTVTTTNISFYFYTQADANLNALNVRVMVQ